MADNREITIKVNGKDMTTCVETRLSLGDVLREHFHLTGTHLGCEHGVCGACTVVVDGEPIRSCLMLGVQAHGKEVTTVEGLSKGEDLHPIQEAFWKNHGLQCGYCTPGFLTTLFSFLENNSDPTEREIREAISGNICRCTGYQNIVNAALDAVKVMKGS
ncbi:MAG: (2Fe-2S)-binding protein [Rhodospirillaceae bacterium]|jgi:carbon-monoxide dehydrogenase small subunit|nr:(2Fe-2S)-binding protein [Rhodospirillaceae bacterium]MBR86767.1 (2Fe-2S)-binding protein [Rhodospirillaceae bacterium]|tara:strand:- start:1034 stop:1513 length:480 start_codon:yes stop_codon:yes gene_type:complete